jgi:hypothetical protein
VITAFLHLGQAQSQALVLPLGRLALLLPLIPASLEERDQLLKGTEKRQRAIGGHQITSLQHPKRIPWQPCHYKNGIIGTKTVK